jgi:hypothetical protein
MSSHRSASDRSAASEVLADILHNLSNKRSSWISGNKGRTKLFEDGTVDPSTGLYQLDVLAESRTGIHSRRLIGNTVAVKGDQLFSKLRQYYADHPSAYVRDVLDTSLTEESRLLLLTLSTSDTREAIAEARESHRLLALNERVQLTAQPSQSLRQSDYSLRAGFFATCVASLLSPTIVGFSIHDHHEHERVRVNRSYCIKAVNSGEIARTTNINNAVYAEVEIDKKFISTALDHNSTTKSAVMNLIGRNVMSASLFREYCHPLSYEQVEKKLNGTPQHDHDEFTMLYRSSPYFLELIGHVRDASKVNLVHNDRDDLVSIENADRYASDRLSNDSTQPYILRLKDLWQLLMILTEHLYTNYYVSFRSWMEPWSIHTNKGGTTLSIEGHEKYIAKSGEDNLAELMILSRSNDDKRDSTLYSMKGYYSKLKRDGWIDEKQHRLLVDKRKINQIIVETELNVERTLDSQPIPNDV